MKIKLFIKEVAEIWVSERPALLAAALAYYGLFSFAPLIYIAFQVAGLFIDQFSAAEQLYQQVQNVLGPATADQARDLVDAVSNTNHSSSILVSVISFLALYFAASGFFFQIEYTLNRIWRVPPTSKSRTRVMVEKRVYSFIMVIGVSALLVAAALLNVILTGFSAVISRFIPLGNWSLVVSSVITFGLLLLSFTLIYRLLPEVRLTWRDVWPGAITASLLIMLAANLAGLYFRHGSFGSAFRAAGAFAVLLIAIYYFAQIFLLGAVITRVYATIYGSRKEAFSGNLTISLPPEDPEPEDPLKSEAPLS